MSEGKDWPKSQPDMERQTPTNREAATRSYCKKHSRAMLDIGGEKKCLACINEEKAQQPKF